MIRGKFLTSQDDVGAVMDIRRRVFVEEQGYPADTDVDTFDKLSVYALAYDENDRPAGTGRLYINADSRFQIGRVCVLPEARGRGLGDLVARMLLYRALELGADAVCLSAQLPVVGFYARYGFRPCGEVYDEEGVPIAGCRPAPTRSISKAVAAVTAAAKAARATAPPAPTRSAPNSGKRASAGRGRVRNTPGAPAFQRARSVLLRDRPH